MDATRLTAFAVPRQFEIVQILGSALLSANPAILANARNESQAFYVSPDTERLPFPIVHARRSLRELLIRYRGTSAVTGPLELGWLSANRQQFTDNVVGFQRSFQPIAIQAPSYAFANVTDAWYGESVQAAQRTATILTSGESMIVQITAQAAAIASATDRSTIAAAFRQLPVSLFFLQIVHDDETTFPAIDKAYIELVRLLSVQASTIPGKVGFFGFICVANGAAGFGGGIVGVEEHSEPVMRTGGGQRTTTKYHVDDVLMVLPPARAAAATLPTYPCQRPCCNGILATSLSDAEKFHHRIRVYRERLDAIATSPGRRNYVKAWLDAACTLRANNGLLEPNAAARIHETCWRPLV